MTPDPFSGAAEFIDANGRKWDVKAFNSYYKPISFEVNDAIGKIQKSINKGEQVILDTRDLNADDLNMLKNAIIKNGLSKNVLYWP